MAPNPFATSSSRASSREANDVPSVDSTSRTCTDTHNEDGDVKAQAYQQKLQASSPSNDAAAAVVMDSRTAAAKESEEQFSKELSKELPVGLPKELPKELPAGLLEELPSKAMAVPGDKKGLRKTNKARMPVPDTNLHYIHGKAYDLREFAKRHPGGADIIRMTQGLPDATPLFESYHWAANRPSILKQLEKFRVDESQLSSSCPPCLYTYEEGGFYRTVARRVRENHFGAKSDNESVTRNIKANAWWVFKISTQILIFAAMFAMAFFVLGSDSFTSRMASCVCAAVSAMFFIQWGFTVMHDASHWAIGARNHWANEYSSRIWCAMALWLHRLWVMHHAVRHHGFTGDEDLDPDTQHANPFVRKHPEAPREKYLKVARLLNKFGMAGWIAWAVLVYALAPGMWLGQVIMYRIVWPMRGYLWKVSYPPKGAYDHKLWEDLISLTILAIQVWRGDWLVSMSYVVAMNVAYAVCILPDHDTESAALEHHLDLDHGVADVVDARMKHTEEPKIGKVHDWGELQARNSSNFATNTKWNWFGELTGGIGDQVIHHIFPSMSHVHFRTVAPTVEATCNEFGIPFNSYETVPSALMSFVNTMKFCMDEEDEASRAKVIQVSGSGESTKRE